MRDIFGLLYDTSLLDAKTVLFFFTLVFQFNLNNNNFFSLHK